MAGEISNADRYKKKRISCRRGLVNRGWTWTESSMLSGIPLQLYCRGPQST